MHEIKRTMRLSQASVHFVTARARLFKDHKNVRFPKRAKSEFLSLFPISDVTVLVRLRDTAECAYARCPDVMIFHSDTTCESARCLHADGFQNHTSSGLSHATNAWMTKRNSTQKTESNLDLQGHEQGNN